MHTKTKGAIAEMAVAAHLIENEWKVLMPIGENHRYDLVAERNGQFVRIQVKYVTPKRGMLEVKCTSSNNWSVLHYTAKEIDAMAVFDSKSRNIYFIPMSKVNYNSFNLRLEPSKNNQKSKINLAKDFLSLNII